jgi:hypothetical protein
MKRSTQREHGATLLVTLIMLIMLTLFAISAMNTGNINLKMVGNMQSRAEAFDAAQRAIETAISTTAFIDTPANAIANPCNGTPNTVCTDLNGDGTPELTTTLAPNPFCIKGKVTKVGELVITSPKDEDVACLQAQSQGTFAVAGAASSSDSLCGQTVWNIRAQTLTAGATAATSDVNFAVTQGVGVRVKSVDLAFSCP